MLFGQALLFAQIVGLNSLRQREPVHVSDAEAAIPFEIELDPMRVKLLQRVLESSSKKHKGAKVSWVLVQGENVLLIKDGFEGKYVCIGKSSRPFVSLLAGAMESCGALNPSLPAYVTSSNFRLSDKNRMSKVTVKDLYSMRAGISNKNDDLFAEGSSGKDIFDFIANADLISYGVFEESALSLTAAAYLAASRFETSEKDLNAAYYNALENFIFKKLDIKGGLSSASAFPPDRGVLLNMHGVAKWLSCETSFGRGVNGAQILDRNLQEERYENIENERRTPAFLKMRIEGMEFYASGGNFQNMSHIVLINKRTRTGFAVFAANADEAACMELATEYSRLLSEIIKRN